MNKMSMGLVVGGLALLAAGGVAYAAAGARPAGGGAYEVAESKARLLDWHGWDIATGGAVLPDLERQLLTALMVIMGLGEAEYRLAAEGITGPESVSRAQVIVQTAAGLKLVPFARALNERGPIPGLIPDPVSAYPCSSCGEGEVGT